MVIWFVAHQRELSAAQAMLTDVQTQEEQLRIHLGRKNEMVVERAHLDERRRLLAALEGQTSIVLVLADISRRLPKTVVITRLGLNEDVRTVKKTDVND